MRRYFGMPVRCHECARVFVVPPQSPLCDSALQADPVRLLDGPVMRCSHSDTGLIALLNLDALHLLVTMKAEIRDWWVSLEQLRWRDWYNPPSE